MRSGSRVGRIRENLTTLHRCVGRPVGPRLARAVMQEIRGQRRAIPASCDAAALSAGVATDAMARGGGGAMKRRRMCLTYPRGLAPAVCPELALPRSWRADETFPPNGAGAGTLPRRLTVEFDPKRSAFLIWVNCFSPSTILPFLRVSSYCDRAQLTGGACSFLIPRVARSLHRGDRRILCRRSAQHAAHPYRDTVARAQTLCSAHRSTSTSFHLNSIAAHVSRPLRSRDRPQGRGHSRRGGSHHGMSCQSQPCCRLRGIAGNHRGIRSSCPAKARRRPSREEHDTASV